MNIYQDKLKDPRWQRKRLEVFQSADWRCQLCGETEKPLHAHHCYYQKRRDPWDYPPGAIIALCEDCHQKHHKGKKHANISSDYPVPYSAGLVDHQRVSENVPTVWVAKETDDPEQVFEEGEESYRQAWEQVAESYRREWLSSGLSSFWWLGCGSFVAVYPPVGGEGLPWVEIAFENQALLASQGEFRTAGRMDAERRMREVLGQDCLLQF
jgi:hypothetical protein